MKCTTFVVEITRCGPIYISKYPDKKVIEIKIISCPNPQNTYVFYSIEEAVEEIRRQIEECRARHSHH